MTGIGKRIASGFLVLSSCLAMAFGAGYEGFKSVNIYESGHFQDVAASEWYHSNVKTAYELGLIKGTSDTQFSPDKNLTLSEAIKLACVLHATYAGNDAKFTTSSPWYQSYVTYAKDNGIISGNYADYAVAATRAQFAQILSAAFPADALKSINDIEDGAIPDVQQTTGYGAAVYALYRAGILTGSGKTGAFSPNTTIKRSEAAAIITRMADPNLRMSVTLVKRSEMTSEAIYEQCSPAVFYMALYDAGGKQTAAGSGVFIASNGEALTNYHVIDGASSAKITTSDGKVYDVEGCYTYNTQLDLAYIKVKGSNFAYLTMNTGVTTGEKAYAIGSPLGLQNTFSDGMISSANQVYEGTSYIQTTAPISSGSSGGALINAQGELIGITTAYFDGGQNLNLAVPVSGVSKLQKTTLKTLTEITKANTVTAGTIAYYQGFEPAPDFGAYFGLKPVSTSSKNGVVVYSYFAAELKDTKQAIHDYIVLLTNCGFVYDSTQAEDGFSALYYVHKGNRIMLGFSDSGSTDTGYLAVAMTRA